MVTVISYHIPPITGNICHIFLALLDGYQNANRGSGGCLLSKMFDAKACLQPHMEQFHNHTNPHIFWFKGRDSHGYMQWKHWNHNQWEPKKGLGISLLKVIKCDQVLGEIPRCCIHAWSVEMVGLHYILYTWCSIPQSVPHDEPALVTPNFDKLDLPTLQKAIPKYARSGLTSNEILRWDAFIKMLREQ